APPSGTPCAPASSNGNAGTTAPAGSTSILRSPPVMSLTFLAKSCAYSWQISFDGQVLCHRMLIGPCAETTLGAATAVAVAPAASTNRRRVVAFDLSDIRLPPVPIGRRCRAAFLVTRW